MHKTTKASKSLRCGIHLTKRKAQTVGHHPIVQHLGHTTMHVMPRLCLHHSLKSLLCPLEKASMVIPSLLSGRMISGVMVMTMTKQRVPGVMRARG